jgi:hypothetical protein
MPRLVFVIGEDADGPAPMFRDLDSGARQEAFRARLVEEAGLVIASVSSPERHGRRPVAGGEHEQASHPRRGHIAGDG